MLPNLGDTKLILQMEKHEPRQTQGKQTQGKNRFLKKHIKI